MAVELTLSIWPGVAEKTEQQAQRKSLDDFLAGVERRSLIMAEVATRDRDEALDLVQDSMLAFAKRYGHKATAEWAPLFHRILQNRIRDWHRRRKVEAKWRIWLHWASDDDKEVDELQQLPDPRPLDPARLVALADSREALAKALEQLPLRQQQAFLLRTWEGLDVAQTALAMGCSEGSVKTHLSRALHRLRIQLEDHWE